MVDRKKRAERIRGEAMFNALERFGLRYLAADIVRESNKFYQGFHVGFAGRTSKRLSRHVELKQDGESFEIKIRNRDEARRELLVLIAAISRELAFLCTLFPESDHEKVMAFAEDVAKGVVNEKRIGVSLSVFLPDGGDSLFAEGSGGPARPGNPDSPWAKKGKME